MNRRGLLGAVCAAIAGLFVPRVARGGETIVDPHNPFAYLDNAGRYHCRRCWRLEPNGTLVYIYWSQQKRGDVVLCHDAVGATIIEIHAHQCLSDPDMSKPNAPVVMHDLNLGFIHTLMLERKYPNLPPMQPKDFAAAEARWYLKDI